MDVGDELLKCRDTEHVSTVVHRLVELVKRVDREKTDAIKVLSRVSLKHKYQSDTANKRLNKVEEKIDSLLKDRVTDSCNPICILHELKDLLKGDVEW